MPIVRHPDRDRYVIIDKQGLEDPRLTFRARGVLAYLLTKPDHWRFNTRELAKGSPEGRNAIMAALRELQHKGYLRRERRRTLGGQFIWEQVLHERSNQPPLPTLGPDCQQVVDNVHHGSVFHGQPSKPTSDYRDSETPETERIDPLTERMIRSCTGRNVKQEAQAVIAMLRVYVDDRIVDEAVGWMLDEAERRPRRPRYYLTMVADRARERGVLVPDLRLEAKS